MCKEPTITDKSSHQISTKLNFQYLQIQPYKPGAEGLNCFSYGLSIVLAYAQNGHFPRRHKYTNYFFNLVSIIAIYFNAGAGARILFKGSGR